jgi:hypothetical protein
MTVRARLPDRRRAETFELGCAGLRYTCTIGRYACALINDWRCNRKKSRHSQKRCDRSRRMRLR